MIQNYKEMSAYQFNQDTFVEKMSCLTHEDKKCKTSDVCSFGQILGSETK